MFLWEDHDTPEDTTSTIRPLILDRPRVSDDLLRGLPLALLLSFLLWMPILFAAGWVLGYLRSL